MNATGMTFGRDGMLYITSRNDGIVYQVTRTGPCPYTQGMGVATGIAFDQKTTSTSATVPASF
jgi:hypothetical protein